MRALAGMIVVVAIVACQSVAGPVDASCVAELSPLRYVFAGDTLPNRFIVPKHLMDTLWLVNRETGEIVGRFVVGNGRTCVTLYDSLLHRLSPVQPAP